MTASALVAQEWGNRVVAEYTSAAITQHYVLWLIQAGAPPDLIEAGLVIVTDELAHSRLSHDVLVAAGASAPPAIDQQQLGLTRYHDRLEIDLARIAIRVFCLGETVAVPLFKHLREGCTEPTSRTALDRILRDEVRHRDFGWDCLDWLLAVHPDAVEQVVRSELATMFRGVDASYGAGNDAVASDDGQLADADRAWGLASPREYREIFERTYERDWAPRFGAREIDAGPAWSQRRAIP